MAGLKSNFCKKIIHILIGFEFFDFFFGLLSLVPDKNFKHDRYNKQKKPKKFKPDQYTNRLNI